jgi:hypothetical protein
MIYIMVIDCIMALLELVEQVLWLVPIPEPEIGKREREYREKYLN